MPEWFDKVAWERKMKLRRILREERRKLDARDRERLFKLNAIGATTSDEKRQLFSSQHYPQKLD